MQVGCNGKIVDCFYMENSLQKDFNQYVEHCTYTLRLRPETIRGYQAVFKLFTALMPEIVFANQLSTSALTKFFKTLEVRKRIVGKNTEKVGVRASTVMTYWSKLRSFFRWLVDEGKIEKTPLPDKSRPQEPIYDNSPALTREEIDRIQSMISLHAKNSLLLRRDCAIATLLLLTGLRKNELVSLQVSDIDMQKDIVVVRGETSKSKRTRKLPLHPLVKAQLKEYFSERKQKGYKTQYLFVSNNKDAGLSVHGMKHWVKRLNNLTGIDFHLHQFRHSFACLLAKNGASSFGIQKLMGHTDLRMTERYLRSLGVEELRDEVYKLSIDSM